MRILSSLNFKLTPKRSFESNESAVGSSHLRSKSTQAKTNDDNSDATAVSYKRACKREVKDSIAREDERQSAGGVDESTRNQ